MAKKKEENLVQVVKAGFKRVDEQFKRVDEQFKKVDEQIESLARSTQQGFADAQTQADERFKLTIDRFERVEADVTDVKRKLDSAVQMLAVKDRDIPEIKLRLSHVERKVGLAS